MYLPAFFLSFEIPIIIIDTYVAPLITFASPLTFAVPVHLSTMYSVVVLGDRHNDRETQTNTL